jgi:DeoR/GlpR family transcriptional regulator of sugar metabolism
MVFVNKVDERDMYQFILEFKLKYKQLPSIGFLTGYYKVNKYTIYRKMEKLEAEGKITRTKNGAGGIKKNGYELT